MANAKAPSRARKSTAKKTTARRKKIVSTDLAVGMVIDASSSMDHLAPSVIAGFNEYLGELRAQEGGTFMTLTVFADEFAFVFDGKPLDEVPALSRETYRPYGNTALYDSIAATVQRIESQLIAEGREDTKVLIVTMTDGQENHSREHTASTLAALVRRYEAKGNYTFVYLGLGQSSEYVGSLAGSAFSGDNGYAAMDSAAGVGYAMASLGGSTATLRSSSKGSSKNMLGPIDLTAIPDDPDPAPAPGSHYTESSLLDRLGGGR